MSSTVPTQEVPADVAMAFTFLRDGFVYGHQSYAANVVQIAEKLGVSPGVSVNDALATSIHQFFMETLEEPAKGAVTSVSAQSPRELEVSLLPYCTIAKLQAFILKILSFSGKVSGTARPRSVDALYPTVVTQNEKPLHSRVLHALDVTAQQYCVNPSLYVPHDLTESLYKSGAFNNALNAVETVCAVHPVDTFRSSVFLTRLGLASRASDRSEVSVGVPEFTTDSDDDTPQSRSKIVAHFEHFG